MRVGLNTGFVRTHLRSRRYEGGPKHMLCEDSPLFATEAMRAWDWVARLQSQREKKRSILQKYVTGVYQIPPVKTNNRGSVEVSFLLAVPGGRIGGGGERSLS